MMVQRRKRWVEFKSRTKKIKQQNNSHRHNNKNISTENFMFERLLKHAFLVRFTLKNILTIGECFNCWNKCVETCFSILFVLLFFFFSFGCEHKSQWKTKCPFLTGHFWNNLICICFHCKYNNVINTQLECDTFGQKYLTSSRKKCWHLYPIQIVQSKPWKKEPKERDRGRSEQQKWSFCLCP